MTVLLNAWNEASASKGFGSLSTTATCSKVSPSSERETWYDSPAGSSSASSPKTASISHLVGVGGSGVAGGVADTRLLGHHNARIWLLRFSWVSSTEAERFEERWEVHAEASAVALALAVPAADRVVLGATPGFDGAVGSCLLLVRGTERDPILLRLEPGVQVVDRTRQVGQLGRAHLADQQRGFGLVVAVHRVLRGTGRGGEDPGVLLRTVSHQLSFPASSGR